MEAQRLRTTATPLPSRVAEGDCVRVVTQIDGPPVTRNEAVNFA